jgi:hypothetical protein
MKKKLTALFIFAVLVAVIAGAVYAGVEPSPFRSHTNKLYSVVNVLESVDMRLEGILTGHPPDPFDVHADIGMIGMLGAMSMQLMELNNRTGRVINMLPSDLGMLPMMTEDALLNVRSEASRIMERAQGGFEQPPDEIGVFDYLIMVEKGAENIVMTVESYLFPSIPLPN